ncbi:MAG: YdiU family protein [Pseudomonadota bacterium]
MTVTIVFDNSYARLPARFYSRNAPARPTNPSIVRLNAPLAEALGLDPDWLQNPDGVNMMSGRAMPEGADPIALAYAGHQFGGFSPQLGDGRAHLLGEILDAQGRRKDIQLKGSGRTAFSRRGDGKAALGPVLREFIIAEAMSALGVPTTRALAALRSGEEVQRETLLPGGVLVRVADSHIRVGTFQYFAARGDAEAITALIAYTTDRHYPKIASETPLALHLLRSVVERQAQLVAQWMSLGFIHGVMNTDNMSVAGETIDYGPCAFMDAYNESTVYSSIDHGGRYAYVNQPAIAQWNLVRLAESLLGDIATDRAQAVDAAQSVLNRFPGLYQQAWDRLFRKKLGLSRSLEGDRKLAEDLLSVMQASSADFTLTFRALADLAEGSAANLPLPGGAGTSADMAAWIERWKKRLTLEEAGGVDIASYMRHTSPAVIARNHAVEQAIEAAVSGDDTPFHELVDALARPFDTPKVERFYTRPPKPSEMVHQTFCGT